MSEVAPARPVLRWHGGKWLLAPWIIGHFPRHRLYLEPFGGAGSVLLRKRRSHSEVYNDLDGEVVNLFHVIRDRGEELRARLEVTPFARDEFRLSYETSDDPVEQARRTVVRCYMGFGTNGHHRVTGFRGNSLRTGTSAAHDWAGYPEHLPAIVERLRGVTIECRPAIELMEWLDSDDALHYLDPPYITESRDYGTDYAHEMDEEGHRELLEVANRLRGGVVISGYGSSLYDELLADWRRVERRAMADGARPRTEVLWLRNCPEVTPDLFSDSLEEGEA